MRQVGQEVEIALGSSAPGLGGEAPILRKAQQQQLNVLDRGSEANVSVASGL